MGGVKKRINRLRDKRALRKWTLVCPECGEAFAAYGDVPVAFLVAEWSKESGSELVLPADMAAILAHEHDPWEFVDRESGLPFMSPEVSDVALSSGVRNPATHSPGPKP